ncbi:MED7 protein-domain-containing protein [Hyaloraphidium curvatum]|nr:MED7 protein-domain-containing protein [Hyaloraphidium curvatum]
MSLEEAPGPAQETSPFPDPPPFYKHYTDAAYRSPPGSDARLASARAGAFLDPPAPVTDRWTSFGVTREVEEAPKTIFEQEGVPQLFPNGDFDRAAALRSLNKALVFNYLELLDVLVRDPGPQQNPQWIRKVQHLHVLIKNLHFLVNGYRPHQARATLQQMLAVQIAERKEAAEKLREAREAVVAELERAGGALAAWAAEHRARELGPPPEPPPPAAEDDLPSPPAPDDDMLVDPVDPADQDFAPGGDLMASLLDYADRSER